MSISVLVVEDDTGLRSLIEHLLVERGYDVHCATNGVEAITTLNNMPPPCLVLWDPITLPINAPLVAHLVRRKVHIATIPVGVSSVRLAADGSTTIAKTLTSPRALLMVVGEHCPIAR